MKKEKYTRWNTATYILKDAWNYSHKMMAMMGLEVVVKAGALVGAVILPAFIIKSLTAGLTVTEIVRNIILVFGIVGLINAWSTYLCSRNQMQYIPWRGRKLITGLPSVMECDYQKYENKETQIQMNKGLNAVETNTRGMENFMHLTALFLADILQLVIYMAMISYMNIWIILFLLGLSVVNYLVNYGIYQKMKKTREAVAENDIHIEYFKKLPYDTATGEDIRLYQMQGMLKNIFQMFNRKGIKFQFGTEKCKMQSGLMTNVVTLIRDALAYGYLIWSLTSGKMDVAAFVLFLGVFSGFSTRFTDISTELSSMMQCLDETIEYRKMLGMLVPVAGDRHLETGELDIVFDHVTFSYPGSDKKILDDFSLHIHPHEKLALVGVNGAGKSTLVKLLCHFYHPEAGKILINGTDLEQIDMKEYQKKISVIFQNTKPFSFTIGENISGLPEEQYDEERVTEALEKAGISDYIRKLEKGIHTYIGKDFDPDGVMLSGGEVQKLLLAREWYHDSVFTIMDEPTAALDAISEQEMYGRYKNYIGKHNALFISHRLASTRFCDRIILLKDGKIAEQGTHEKLMDADGYYAEMFRVQSKYYQEVKTDDDEGCVC